MNPYKKGKMLERLAEHMLLQDGWTIYFRSIRMKYRPVDFGEFDFVCEKNKCWLFVQVKSRFDNQQWERIEQWKANHAPQDSICQMWIWNDETNSFDISSIE